MDSQPNNRGRKYMDTAAVVLSGVCMLHCLALPIALTILPIVNVTLLDESTFHLIMMAVILPISIIALTIGCRQHKDKLTLVLGTVGLGILTITAIFGHDLLGLTGERIVTSIGGLILAAAHIQNYLCCRNDDCAHEH
ncbi:MAG TPA: MerC domain-containing protein [Gammaproteobacteria bacterium]|nr:MerC domain-containing protein [Gammaproteobacteria bacterium]